MAPGRAVAGRRRDGLLACPSGLAPTLRSGEERRRGARRGGEGHSVRPGRLQPKFARPLARAAADRNAADYNASATFTAEDAAEALERSAEFPAEVQRLVTASGEPPQ